MLTGRVIEVQRVHISVTLDDSGQTVRATVRGEFHETGMYPKVGDRVNVALVEASEEAQAVIQEILPRTSVITRLDQETRQEQILVTNVDIGFYRGQINLDLGLAIGADMTAQPGEGIDLAGDLKAELARGAQDQCLWGFLRDVQFLDEGKAEGCGFSSAGGCDADHVLLGFEEVGQGEGLDFGGAFIAHFSDGLQEGRLKPVGVK